MELICRSVQVKDAKINGMITLNNYFIELENGYRIQIKPAFKDDYRKLRMLAKVDND